MIAGIYSAASNSFQILSVSSHLYFGAIPSTQTSVMMDHPLNAKLYVWAHPQKLKPKEKK